MEKSSSGQVPGQAYFLSQSAKEIDRLDIQHYALAMAVGDLYLAPIDEPRRILDVGCGTGQWCSDLCAGLPNALVVGFDLNESRTTDLPNYRFVRGNVLEGLPFEDSTFGFVHQRALIAGLPLVHWSRVVAELIRVTEPGGWIELVECLPFLTPEGEAARRIWSIFRRRMDEAGLDTTGHVHNNLAGYLRDAGLINVHTRTVPVPVGDWGDEIGAIMKADIRALATETSPLLAATYHISIEAQSALIQHMLDELETLRPHLSFRLAWAQRTGHGVGEPYCRGSWR